MPAIFDYNKALENDLTPDASVTSIPFEATGPTYGVEMEVESTTILKGNDQNYIPYLSYSVSGGPAAQADVDASLGISKGFIWSLSRENNYVYTRSMIEGDQISISLSVSGKAGLRGGINFGIDISYDGSLLETAFGKRKAYDVTSITIKAGASIGTGISPGIKPSGTIRYGKSSAATHPYDWAKLLINTGL